MRLPETDGLEELLQRDLTEKVFEQILGILEHEQHKQIRSDRGVHHEHPNPV